MNAPGDCVVQVELCDARGNHYKLDVDVHRNDHDTYDGAPTRLVLTVIPENMMEF